MANPSYIVRRFPEGIFSTFPAATRFGNPADAEAFLRKSFSEELVESVDLRRDFGPARFFHKKESPVSAWNQCAMIIFDPIGGQLI